jgi:hypothetical protein
MTKFLLGTSFLCLSFLLFFGMNDPGAPVMWLASDTRDMNVLRITLMIILLGSLLASGYFNKQIKIILSTLALLLIGYALRTTYINHMKFEDTLVIVMAGISIITACLEPKTRLYTTTQVTYRAAKSRQIVTA